MLIPDLQYETISHTKDLTPLPKYKENFSKTHNCTIIAHPVLAGNIPMHRIGV